MARTLPPQASSPPTIGDVAALAGVSRSAVSRAYTPGAHVSPANRERIAAAAKALGYRPNLIARSLSTRRSNTIAVAMTRLENSFHADLLQHLGHELQERGLQMLLFLTDPDSDPDPPIDALLRHRVDAIVLSAVRFSSDFAAECRAAGVPVLMVNRTAADVDVSTVVGENFEGGRLVADLFARAGHTRPVFVSGFENSSTSREREQGFRAGLADAGLEPLNTVDGRFDQKHTAGAMRDLLAGPVPPDAVFCANDHMAVAALQVARHEFGLTVGRDISIAGYDDSIIAALPDIGLTSIAQPAALLARAAAQALDALVADPAAQARHHVVACSLVERTSTRKTPGR